MKLLDEVAVVADLGVDIVRARTTKLTRTRKVKKVYGMSIGDLGPRAGMDGEVVFAQE